MDLNARTNLYALQVDPPVELCYRGQRNQFGNDVPADLVAFGQHAYSLVPHSSCRDRVAVEPAVVVAFVRARLAEALLASRAFFDVSSHFLEATVSGDLIYREDSFSIAKRFQLQPSFDDRRKFVAVDFACRIYNRVRLPVVLSTLGPKSIGFPMPGLVFTAYADVERWQDCRIVTLLDNDNCVVRLSLSGDELQVPQARVIPRLPLAVMIKLARQTGSMTNLDSVIKRAHATTGRTTLQDRIADIVTNHLKSVFPLYLEKSKVELSLAPLALEELGAVSLAGDFGLTAASDDGPGSFLHVREGLRDVTHAAAEPKPVVLFCTAAKRQRAKNLIHQLNEPASCIGGFAGMPKHFGVKLELLPDGIYEANQLEDYIETTKQFVESPDPKKRDALALYALDIAEETHAQPIPLYYRLKAALARAGHASQFLDNDTLTNDYALWNLALNTAAKLGAVPWTLEMHESLAPVDLFLGFSYSSIRTESMGQSRNIAYVNVFDQPGAWRMFCAESSTFSFEERLKVFPRLAASAIRTATEAPRNLRLIEVHYNKKFSRTERKAVVDGIRDAAPKASVIFVSISDDHPVRFLDQRDSTKAAERGTALIQGSDRAYLQTVRDVAGTEPPRPLRVQTYREFCSLPETIDNICSRLLALTRLNWRSVRDYAALPVTILYSRKVAKFTNYFSLEDWTDIDHRLKRTPWFI